MKITKGWLYEIHRRSGLEPHSSEQPRRLWLRRYPVCGTLASMMEQEIEKGSKLRDIAERTSHEADTEGITGFMYGCAVNILVHVWVYGEELRRWHNHEYDYDGDGVVNPAILTVRG